MGVSEVNKEVTSIKIKHHHKKGIRTDLLKKILWMIDECNNDPLGSSGYEIQRKKTHCQKLSNTRWRLRFCSKEGEEKLVVITDTHGNIVEQTMAEEVEEEFNLPKGINMEILQTIHLTQSLPKEDQNRVIKETFPNIDSDSRWESKMRLFKRGYTWRESPDSAFVITDIGEKALKKWITREKTT